jgi:aminobenzoyl-glutamate transport protein
MTPSKAGFANFVERVGHKIPDPVIIFMAFYPAAFLLTVFMGGHTFETAGAGGENVQYSIRAMYEAEHMRWIFDNALLTNWLGFGGGVLGVIFVVMLAIGVAERSGLFGALIKRAGSHIPQAVLPLLLIFIGIISSIATDAGYLVLIPLAGLLYAGLGRNPLIGMAAAFAGVSAGFSANLMPGPVDVIVGMNAQVFAEAQGVPFTNADWRSAQSSDDALDLHRRFHLPAQRHGLLGDAPFRRARLTSRTSSSRTTSIPASFPSPTANGAACAERYSEPSSPRA